MQKKSSKQPKEIKTADSKKKKKPSEPAETEPTGTIPAGTIANANFDKGVPNH
jgi:hypothetical protein